MGLVMVRFAAGDRGSSLLQGVQTGFGDHPTEYKIDVRGLFPGTKRLERAADNSPASSAEVKNGGSLLPLPHTSSWRGA
jgi:hypothetical protein